jgi:hypothetical protein
MEALELLNRIVRPSQFKTALRQIHSADFSFEMKADQKQTVV